MVFFSVAAASAPVVTELVVDVKAAEVGVKAAEVGVGTVVVELPRMILVVGLIHTKIPQKINAIKMKTITKARIVGIM